MAVILAELMGLRRLGWLIPLHQRRGDRGWRAQDPGGGVGCSQEISATGAAPLSHPWLPKKGLSQASGFSIDD